MGLPDHRVKFLRGLFIGSLCSGSWGNNGRNKHEFYVYLYTSSFAKFEEKDLTDNDKSYLKTVYRDMKCICYSNFLVFFFFLTKHSMDRMSTFYLNACLAAEVSHYTEMNEPWWESLVFVILYFIHSTHMHWVSGIRHRARSFWYTEEEKQCNFSPAAHCLWKETDVHAGKWRKTNYIRAEMSVWVFLGLWGKLPRIFFIEPQQVRVGPG